jgi:methylated-DNA-[protein]-cysteine S-methyltransferase
MICTFVESPIGRLLLTSDGEALTGLAMDGRPQAGWREDRGWFAAARAQLEAYFAGELRGFDLPLAPRGTPFQERVWEMLLTIPHGATRTYAEIAARVGKPSASRAVGAANGRNPIAIIIPCHRVVGADGGLTGYAGGLARKAWLLRHERAACPPATARRSG